MPLSQTQNEHEKLKETVQKTKRCGTQRRKNRFLLLSTKEDSNKERTIDKIINVGISKQNLDDHTIKNAKSGKAASKRMITEGHKDEMLLQALKENLNAEDVIINSQEKSKKCNTGKYICHCKEENCFSSSSKKSSSGMLGSKIDKLERTNRRLINQNTKPYILQQKSPILYHENPHELPLPNLIDHFSIQPYQEKINIPPVPVLYGIVSDISPHIVENEKQYVEIPFTSFEKSNYLVGNNQYQSIHQKPCVCAPITEGHQVKSSMSATSPSINYVDTTTIRETTNNLESNNLIGQTEKDQEHFPELTTENPNVDLSAHSEKETNLPLNYLTKENNAVSSFNLNEVTSKPEDFSEQTERNPDNNLSKLTTFSTGYAGKSNAPSFIYDGTNDGKFINMEECIQLFGRDVCVLSATSPKMLAKQAQENNFNKYSTIRIPEYVTQMSAKKETMLNNNYLDKFKITGPYFAPESSTNGINKSNINLNKYLESTSVKSNVDVDKAFPHEFHQYSESIGQISEPDDKNKSFSTAKSTHTPIKKLIDPINDETAKAEKNKLLGKSKTHTTKLLLNSNDKEIANSTSGEKFLYSTPSYKSSSDEEMNNLKINQQNQITNTNSNSSTSPKEETIVNSYDSKTRYDSKEQNRNDLKKSNMDIYFEKKIPQEHFKDDTTTISSNSKTGYNFEEVTKKEIIGIEPSVHPEEISEGRFTTMQYIDDKKLSNLNHKEDITNNVEEFIDSSTSKLPFCDNTLLLNSIRKVINDFTLDSRLTKTKDLNENILQTQGKNLLPKILQVPNLKNILSMPQIENTIVEKVKDVLSYVTAIPKRDFTNDWSHGVIKNTLHSILDALSGFHHKLPPMTLEEHQFKNGQWRTNLVTLAPILDQRLSKGIPENLRESITDLLSSPAITSQIDQDIVRNMVVQSVKNSLTNNENDKMDDSITHVLNEVLQTLKNSKDINTLESSEVISDEEDMEDMSFSQEIPTNNYEIGINVDNSTLNNKQNLDTKEDKMDSKKITDYQKAKTLENNANILTTSELPHLLQLAKIKENIRDFEQIKTINMQDNTEKKLVEPKITYQKAILQNNPNVLAILEPDSAGTEQNIKNHRIDEESIKDTTTITNFIQETSPDYVQVSDSKMLENAARPKDVGVKHTLNEKTLTTSTEIDPLIILERIKFNLPPTKYYSPEILKYATSRIDDKNVEITTASTNFIQETSSNHTQMSDNVILQNTIETNHKDEMAYPLTTTSGNLISSTNVEYKDYKPKTIALTDKNILESQQNSQQNFTEGNIIKIHEVTTEIQRTYAKTTYFKTEPFSDNNPRITSSSLTCENTDICVNNNNKKNNNDNMGDDNNNLNGDKINIDNAIKVKEVISTSKLSATNNTDPSHLFPSSIAPDDISELQKSQLYYTSDGMKLPLEIKRLEDGSYALSISKNICEQILTRKCPCCVPLQGYVVQSLKNHQQEDMHAMTLTTTEKKDKENTYVNNNKKDYQSVQPFNTMVTSMITRRNALKTQKSKEEEEEKKINAAHLWKQNDNLTIILPVVDFAKKYNLSLDYNEEIIPFKEARLQNKIQNYDKLLMKSGKISEYGQSEEKNLNNYLDIKKNRFLGDSNIIVEVRKANAEMNQSEIGQESKLREARTANDIQNTNIKQKVNSENREKTNTVFKGINISERSKINKGEIKWDKLSDIIEGNYYITCNKN